MPSLGVMRFAGLRALKMILEFAFVSLEVVTEVVVVVSGLYWILIFVEGLGDGVRVVFVRGLYCSLGSTDTEDDLTEVVVVVSGLYWILIFVEGLGDGVKVVGV